MTKLLQRLVVSRLAGTALFEALQQLLARFLLCDSLIRQVVAVAESPSYRGPEELLFDGFVL